MVKRNCMLVANIAKKNEKDNKILGGTTRPKETPKAEKKKNFDH